MLKQPCQGYGQKESTAMLQLQFVLLQFQQHIQNQILWLATLSSTLNLRYVKLRALHFSCQEIKPQRALLQHSMRPLHGLGNMHSSHTALYSKASNQKAETALIQ